MKPFLSILFLFSSLIIVAQKSESRFKIKNSKVNTKYSDFGTTFYQDSLIVFASPDNKHQMVKRVWKGNNQPFLELYIGKINEKGDIDAVEKFSKNVNTKYHEADVTFTKDGKKVFFTRNNYFNDKYTEDENGMNHLSIYIAEIDENGEWINEKEFPYNSANYSVGHPSLSADEKTLYFVSDMPNGFGQTDIYKISVKEDGTFGEAENLGEKINTKGKEMFPFLDVDNVLYFASNGMEEKTGGLDVYAVKIYPDYISDPKLLDQKINTKYDDFAFVIHPKTRKGYLSSNRKSGKGDDDIYFFEEKRPIKFDCYEMVEGEISLPENILGETIVSVLDAKKDTIVSQKLINKKYKFKLPCEEEYEIVLTNDLFKEKRIPVETSYKNGQTHSFASELEYKKPQIDEKIVLDKIHFDLDKWNIRPDAVEQLDEIIAILKQYPDIKVHATSHTDSRASDAYNQKLSQNRAKSTVEYLIKNGIAADRITFEGKGEMELVNKCKNNVKCSEEEHQQNRRTEFLIVE
ncbi:OmpA family protein [Aureivirga sp. CE67]|uniref:OmpA family protein n=1 Tax=Aureivirga sp. CE67 TaxID=1788983 RepID=UPI0018CB3252|nr:OmpA family protein [Aureivirga sp. CE67]